MPLSTDYGKTGSGNHERAKKQFAPITADTRERTVIDLLEKVDTITRKDTETALGVSQATAVLILRKMVDKGILEKEGGGKYLRYRLKTIE